jgi:hypothetical protein
MLGSMQKLGRAILVAAAIGGAANLLGPQPSMAQEKEKENALHSAKATLLRGE